MSKNETLIEEMRRLLPGYHSLDWWERWKALLHFPQLGAQLDMSAEERFALVEVLLAEQEIEVRQP